MSKSMEHTNIERTSRDSYWDFVKFFAITLVVYGHVIQNCGYANGGGTSKIQFIL